MSSQEAARGALDSVNAKTYPVQDALLGGEYPQGRMPAPSKQGKVAIDAQEILLGRNYPTKIVLIFS